MAARTKFAAAVAAVAALWAAMLLCGCGEASDEIPASADRIFTDVLADGRTIEVPTCPQEGYYMQTVDGVPYFFEDEPGNVCMLVPELEEIGFDGFTNGDRVAVWWSICEETYPGYLHIYDIVLVEDGSVDDLPQSVKNEIDAIKSPTLYFSPDDLPVLIHEEHTFTRTRSDGQTEDVTVSSTNGYLLITDDGTCVFARYHDDLNDGVVVIGHRDSPLFEGLASGDRVLVWFDGPILESYPGQGTIFTIAKIMDGRMNMLPDKVKTHVKQLESLGWSFAE